MSTKEENELRQGTLGLVHSTRVASGVDFPWSRPAKLCRLTPKIRNHVRVETSEGDKLAGAMAPILRPAEQESEP